MLSCAGLSAGVEPGEGEALNGEAESESKGWLEFTALPLFRLLQPSLSPTLRVPEAASKELSYPRAAHTDFPPSSPFPSTTITLSSSTSASASSPPPELTPSLVVTPPTRAPVYLSGHMVGEAVLKGVADRRRETDDSLIHRPPVTSAYLITTSNYE
ncbi:hypothetical protein G5I_13540 [Acromyrmex echinatior]|uniref:Uncharacterized protein n=1 Tax=Acromyrmex echinatior TaxID=103372 RepID=F4X5B2_ACREC|nr:hypothetical protein G5I_13540 [Acromyrmex echinatior]